jgi:tRNA (guanine37-N1)-methyltransferase
MWQISILTLFPEIYPGPLAYSVIGKAFKVGIWKINVYNLRDFAKGKHRTVDDTSYGGGSGLIIRADVLGDAIDACFLPNKMPIYCLSPRGRPFNQKVAREIVSDYPRGVNIICGRYEGIDERLFKEYNIAEISMGDYIVSSGDVALFSFVDCCIRLLPGVLDKKDALIEESFGEGNFTNLLEYPHFTKPTKWRSHEVPEVLISGNHQEIEKWRLEQAEDKTKKARPDLWDQYLKERL